MTTYFDKLNGARVTDVLNVLGEAPFFYREDDAELFQFLRRNRAEFERFYRELYGWELLVDARTARLYKERWHNRGLRPSQRDIFDLTRRDDCLGFLLLLEFHATLLEQHNLAGDDEESPRFLFGELFGFARTRMTEVLGADAPDEDGVRRILRGLWPALERYRFVRVVERGGDEAGPDGDDELEDAGDRVLYEALPALHHYDIRALGPAALASAFGAGAEGGSELDAEVAP